MKKTFSVTDLGGGDGGKGGVVHGLCARLRPHTVIKVGGAQGSHGVTTAAGDSFAYSQFGCGTFNGVKTYVSDRFVASPIGLLNEADALHYEHGVADPFSMLTVDGSALCTTPYHGIASRLKELARRDNPRGIVGVGVGEAYQDSLEHPEMALYARDLLKDDLQDRLRNVLEHKRAELAPLIDTAFLPEDTELAQEQLDRLYDEGFFTWILDQFMRFAKQVRIVDADYLEREILSPDGVLVVESSHGILTDRLYGFHPHTTRLRTLPEITTWGWLREHNYNGDVVKLGVTRAYQIRHGAGPLVVDDARTFAELAPGEVGQPDRYRGAIRVGPLDMVSLRYALNVCGGAETFDGLAVTWLDHATRAGEWRICDEYEATDPRFFASSKQIRVYEGPDREQLRYQEALTRALNECRPHVVTHPLPAGSAREGAVSLCRGVLSEQLGVPVRMISFGPTELDKIYI